MSWQKNLKDKFNSWYKVQTPERLNSLTLGGVVAVCILVAFGLFITSDIQNSDAILLPLDKALAQKSTVYARFETSEQLLTLELASNAAEWSKGLMFRTELAENSGMLFVFPDVSNRNFWMKNTFVSLDIIYLDREGRIVNMHTNTKINQTDEQYASSAPAKYVVELPAGTAEKLNLATGNKLLIFD